jgi:Uma2 family endonuclease
MVRAVNRQRLRDRVYGPVDLAIEVLSPSTSRRDRIEKLALYAQHGVAEFWIVDADARVLDFLTLRDGAYQVAVAQDGLYQSPLFPEVVIDIADFWSLIDRRLS